MGTGLTPAPTMSADEARSEAHRCLMCWDAPCIRACPTGIDVPKFIKQIATGDLTGSAHTILSANILGASCARVCPTEVLCEGACVMNDLQQRPIEIGHLQAFATDDVLFGQRQVFTIAEPRGTSIGVIGAGPAGLSVGAELAKLGHRVTIYDANEDPGGLNTYGVANYKMDMPTSLLEVAFIQSFGVDFQQGVTVGADVTVDSLVEAHDALFVGVGLGSVPPIGLPGEDLDHVEDALAFIASVRAGGVDLTGQRVAVVGGGNTAVDAVTQAAMSGAERVYLLYRRGRAEMGGYPKDVDRALRLGVEFVHWAVPIEILGEGSVAAIVCARTDFDGDGTVRTIAGSEFTVPVDRVYRATGQAKRSSFMSLLDGVECDPSGRVVVDEEHRTGNPRIWAGGDCVNGGKEVVNAVQHGKLAARSIHKTLVGKE
ncbi:MAG: NAD(P)-dependent oxidoreductase [Acidimicrobiia bacterium]|nr:NAD(P)-dependent oxidoreductase [Acidimicrobiia bacterium]